ncbi:hypothetical protein [Hyphomonas sp. UBA4494]|uniref:hypothetical protein n=1 Tax=Hyphomonas sp. UBA4494 TaxID=1946631 RepID=UPI0025C31BAA|nr:hypothetical protein [Hyphomonas sp. UBA4494]
MAAGAWILLFRVYDIRPSRIVLCILIVLSLQPIYTSAVLVDAWFFPAIVLLLSARKLPEIYVGILAGLLLSGHGSGQIFALVFAVLAAVLFRSRRQVVAGMVAAVIAFGTNVLLDAMIMPETPRLSKTFPAARVFSVQPELLQREADRSGNLVLSKAANEVVRIKTYPENKGRRDLFWDVWKTSEGEFDLAKFEEHHSLPILKDAFMFEPVPLARTIFLDFLSYYGPATQFDFQPVLSEPFPERFYASHQAKGFFAAVPVELAATILRYGCYLAFAAALFFGWRRTGADIRRTIIGIGLIAIANDALFALLSGPPDRYHHRILPLLAIGTVFLISGRVKQPVEAPA